MASLEEIRVPDIGDFKDVEIIEVAVAPGDSVAVDATLITLETEKATMDVPSTVAGVVRELKVSRGGRVSQGDLIALVETAPGATHFYVFNSTMTEVLETLYAPIEISLDIDGRNATVRVPGLIDSKATPIIDPNSGAEFRAGFALPNGFQMTSAEIATGSTQSRAGIALDLSASHAHLATLHMNQDGVIR